MWSNLLRHRSTIPTARRPKWNCQRCWRSPNDRPPSHPDPSVQQGLESYIMGYHGTSIFVCFRNSFLYYLVLAHGYLSDPMLFFHGLSSLSPWPAPPKRILTVEIRQNLLRSYILGCLCHAATTQSHQMGVKCQWIVSTSQEHPNSRGKQQGTIFPCMALLSSLRCTAFLGHHGSQHANSALSKSDPFMSYEKSRGFRPFI